VISIAFIHFKTLNLHHLDAALFTLAKQDFKGVKEFIVLDNNSDEPVDLITSALSAYQFPIQPKLVSLKHGDLRRTHTWSSNEAFRQTNQPWVFLCRSDFLLDYDCLSKFVTIANNFEWRKAFITSYCQQMGCDDALSNTDVLVEHSYADAGWRTHPDGPKSLVNAVPSNYFHDTDQDAGVYLMDREAWQCSGGLDERLVGWGTNQSRWQNSLPRYGTKIFNIEEYLFHHQHHWAERVQRYR